MNKRPGTTKDNPFVQRYRAFLHALCGGRTLLRTQAHAKFHLLASLSVVIMGLIYRVERWEWAALLLAMGLVWVAEALNTAVEFLADELSLEWRERIKNAKDIAAFAVLVAAIIAMALGALIFIPRLLTD